MSDIIVFKSIGQYGVIGYFIDELVRALNNLNKTVGVINLDREQHEVITNMLIKEDPDLCIGFNEICFHINGMPYYEYLNIKHLAFLVDHPVYHLPAFDLDSKNLYISCVDSERVNYLKTGVKFLNSLLLYHAVGSNIEFNINNKEYNVVTFGTMLDYELLRKEWENRYKKNVVKVLEAAIEIGMSNPSIPTDKMLELALDYYNINFIYDDRLKIDYILIPEIDRYLRYYFRHKFFSNFKNTTIYIFGRGPWKKYLKENNFVVRPAISIQEAINVMQKSKITVNYSIPTFYNGSHERPLFAAMSGSLVLSNYSPFFAETLEDYALLFSIKHMDNVEERINSILSNDNLRIRMVKGAREKVVRSHTWKTRAREILNLFDVI